MKIYCHTEESFIFYWISAKSFQRDSTVCLFKIEKLCILPVPFEPYVLFEFLLTI